MKFVDNPNLIHEEANEEDLYSTLFPKAKKSSNHGLGLTVGGKNSEKLALALSALHDVTQENKNLRGVVEKLVETQSSLVARSDKLEEKYCQMMELFQTSQKRMKEHIEEPLVEESEGFDKMKNSGQEEKQAVDDKKRKRQRVEEKIGNEVNLAKNETAEVK